VARLRNAGSLFVGPYAPESPATTPSGANHVLPTGGLARSCGALSTESYGKFIQVQRITRDGLARIRDAVEAISEAEGLMAHKRAVEIRFEGEGAGAVEAANERARHSAADLRLGTHDGLPGRQVCPAARVDRAVRREHLAGSTGLARRPRWVVRSVAKRVPTERLLGAGRRGRQSYGVAPDELLPTAGADEAWT